jgi:3-oxoadipate enol-lactonase
MPGVTTIEEAAGARVHVRRGGAGPTLLCLHGLGGGVHFFETLGRSLSDRYATLALDLPGSGLSSQPASLTFEHLADVVAAIGSRHSPLALVGHSMGTIIGLEALRRDPALARGFVAVGGIPEPQASSRDRIAARADRIAATGLEGLGEEVAAANLSERTIRQAPGLAALFGRTFEQQSPEGYVATARALASWTAPPLPPLGGVSCLLVAGEDDRYAPPDAMRAFQATLPPGTALELIPGCAHLPFLERPAEFSALIRTFLDRLEPKT